MVAAQRFGLVSGMAFGPLLGVDPLPAPGEVSARIARVARTVDLLVGCTRLDAAPFVIELTAPDDPNPRQDFSWLDDFRDQLSWRRGPGGHRAR